MAVVPLAAVVSSPVQRCLDTAEAVRAVEGPGGPRGKTLPRPELVVVTWDAYEAYPQEADAYEAQRAVMKDFTAKSAPPARKEPRL